MFNILARFKVYFSRASIYISLLNFLMILATFKLTYNINVSAIIIVPLGMLFTFFIGWLDYNLVMKHEIKHNNKQNNIKTQLDYIQKQLEEIKNKHP